MKVQKANLKKERFLFIKITCIVAIILALPCIAYAAPDVTGVISQANTDLGTTLNPIPKAFLPIFYLVVAILTFSRICFLAKEWFEHKNDDRESKEITSKIQKTLGLAIGIAIAAPLVIKLINILFGTHLSA